MTAREFFDGLDNDAITVVYGDDLDTDLTVSMRRKLRALVESVTEGMLDDGYVARLEVGVLWSPFRGRAIGVSVAAWVWLDLPGTVGYSYPNHGHWIINRRGRARPSAYRDHNKTKAFRFPFIYGWNRTYSVPGREGVA